MRIARRFSNHSLLEHALFLKALLFLGVVKVSLFLLPFRTVHRLITSRVSKNDHSSSGDMREIAQITWAVRAASHYVPRATCLPQALVTQILLSQRGYSSELHIGILRNDSGQIQGHAWVERKGEIIIGGTETAQYTLLTSLETK